MQVSDRLLSLLSIVFLYPLFILRFFHHLWTRILFRDRQAHHDVDRFYKTFTEHLEDVEIRPGRVIHLLDAIPNSQPLISPASTLPSSPTVAETPTSKPKPILLFVHGSCSRMGHFDFQVRHFIRSGYHVVAFDMLGCGRSSRPADQSYGLKAHLADLFEVMEMLSKRYTSNIVIVGHSAGGCLAMTIATLSLPRVVGCVAIAPVSMRHYKTFDFRLGWFFSLPSAILWLIRPVTHLMLRKNFFGSKATQQLIAMESEASSQNSVHVYKAYYSKTKFSELMISENQKAKKNLLIIGASDDKVTPVSGCRENYDFFRSHKEEEAIVELVEIPDTGHCLCSEDPELVNSILENFIERCSQSNKP